MSFDVSKWNKKRYLAEAGIVGDKSVYDQYLDIVIDYLREANGGDAADYLERTRNFITNTMSKVQEGQTVHEAQEDLESVFTKEFGTRSYSNDNSLTIRASEDLSDETFEKMIKFVEDKGYKVDRAKSTNYYDDDGEKKVFPNIRFSK
jgi:hypothetical protein